MVLNLKIAKLKICFLIKQELEKVLLQLMEKSSCIQIFL